MPLLHPQLVALLQRSAGGALIATAIGLSGRRAGALTSSGVVAAIVIGALSFAFGGLLVASAIIIFFISGSLLGHMRSTRADQARSRAPKDATRDAAQVIANGAVATACAVIAGLTALGGAHISFRWLIAAVCAIAAAAGDTWSTEIGALSAASPRRISDWHCVPAGTSGGVTWLGTIAAPLGGGLVGLAGLTTPGAPTVVQWVGLCALVGLVGSVLDSVLGATLQAVWKCPACSQRLESRSHAACDARGELLRGIAWLDNDGVNAMTTLCGAFLGYIAGAAFT